MTTTRTHIPTNAIDDETLAEMYGLYGPNHHVSRGEFFERVRGQFDYVALFRLRRGRRLIGFTGVRARVLTLESGQEIPTVYSGLSFILPEFRGGAQLVYVLAYHVLRMKLRRPRATVIVWSDNISYKPYVLTARHIRRFYPSRFVDTPADMVELRDQLGARYYGDLYQRETGTVRKPQARLKAHVAPIGSRELADLDIQFYAEHNPGHAHGDGLLTLIPADLRNVVAGLTYGILRPRQASSRRARASAQLRAKGA
ncbi:hypothetical protein DB30_05895 [Enhygromyxa salina]|uniref:Uncharacterized protein n=1 Tax=Enhygromyxa salina TaxID=215803 RepID=A0A0C2D036_9BACT|nr:hypothetical protein [Enhygromyxa salina]KIG15195.1 hypothetical protein DB30_05895 [Enhygromyxa salina]